MQELSLMYFLCIIGDMQNAVSAQLGKVSHPNSNMCVMHMLARFASHTNIYRDVSL